MRGFRWAIVGRLVVSAGLALGVDGCVGLTSVPPQPATTYIPTPTPCPTPFTQRGKASWYGAAHHGKTTASGQPFDMAGMTAAHRTLPFGSRIEVENLHNGEKAVVTVNDRGPFVRGRIVDVSAAAAEKLGFAGKGTTPVKITTINGCTEPEQSAATTAGALPVGGNR